MFVSILNVKFVFYGHLQETYELIMKSALNQWRLLTFTSAVINIVQNKTTTLFNQEFFTNNQLIPQNDKKNFKRMWFANGDHEW